MPEMIQAISEYGGAKRGRCKGCKKGSVQGFMRCKKGGARFHDFLTTTSLLGVCYKLLQKAQVTLNSRPSMPRSSVLLVRDFLYVFLSSLAAGDIC